MEPLISQAQPALPSRAWHRQRLVDQGAAGHPAAGYSSLWADNKGTARGL